MVGPLLTKTSPVRAQKSLGTDQRSFKEYEGEEKAEEANWFAPRNSDCTFREVTRRTACAIQFDLAVSAGLCPLPPSLNCYSPPFSTLSMKEH